MASLYIATIQGLYSSSIKHIIRSRSHKHYNKLLFNPERFIVTDIT
ncbi:hypothetical protein APHNP_0016 [Anaplasma phagocytophilum str. ApNP]|uniref:Uncharacterized protein n=1 Tax=Anaplasma phagocytophilum str. ApNP TaxID=1359153 RepID=A0A0F3NHM6_ANAPH|nr:hypothetical protein APHNP_0016 [Anaplasma phagocytophilum str. ApNP]